MRKINVLLLLAVIAALLVYAFFPHSSKEDQAYYVSVFCAIRHDDSQHFLADMKTVIEGGNSDYALQKIHFQPGLAKQTLRFWQTLTPAQQATLRESPEKCHALMAPAFD